MFDFKQVQTAFPDDKLELLNGKILLNDLPIQTKWPTETDLAMIRKYHGEETENMYFKVILDNIQMMKDVRVIGFAAALEASQKRIDSIFGTTNL